MQQVTTPSEPLQIRVGDVLSRHGEPPWAEQLLSDGRNLAVLICNNPGQTNDAHVHPDFNEGWIVLKGELPSPIDPPTGCAFHTRCAFATEKCTTTRPEMRNLEGRQISCHHAETI